LGVDRFLFDIAGVAEVCGGGDGLRPVLHLGFRDRLLVLLVAELYLVVGSFS